MSIDDIAGAFVKAIKKTLNEEPGSGESSTAGQQPPKKPKYNPPTLFQSLRREPSTSKKRIVRRPKTPTRLTYYVRDILLLPSEFRCPSNNVSIPRSKKRSLLAQAGLVGKIEINSGMSDRDVRAEVCEVFSQVMGLSEENIKNGALFPFLCLQKAGADSRTLCVPSVKDSFEWNGKQVASLAKSGGVIYILAQDDIPGWQIKVSTDWWGKGE